MTSNKKYPIPTSEWEDIEEALSLIYHRFEKGVRELTIIREDIEKVVGPEILNILKEKNFTNEEKEHISLTPEGDNLARSVIRRHRLAERLLTDVLSMESRAVDPNACRLEHILTPEVADSICTLLGHPAQCPHGSLIPTGDCCRRAEEHVEPLVESLDHMTSGASGKVAYIALQNHPYLHKLLSLGVVPGTPIHLHQTLPSYVIELGETQLALEKDVAKHIYVRKK